MIIFLVLFSLNYQSHNIQCSSKEEAQSIGEAFLKNCKTRNDVCRATIVTRRM